VTITFFMVHSFGGSVPIYVPDVRRVRRNRSQFVAVFVRANGARGLAQQRDRQPLGQMPRFYVEEGRQ